MADAAFEAAVAMLNSAPAEPAPSTPVPDAPTTPADAPTSDTPTPTPAAPEAPAPEAPTPAVDADAQLLADLEARRAARQQKAPPPVDPTVAKLQQDLAEVKALLAKPQTLDLKALIAEHGPVEGMRLYGLDPVDFFDQFRKAAKERDPAIAAAQRAAEAAEAKANDIATKYETAEQTRARREQEWADHQSEQRYHAVIESKDLGLKYLPKLTPDERMEATRKTAARLVKEERYTVDDFNEMTDGELARLTERDYARHISRFTGTDPGATTTTTTVPATDGAKTKPPASLTNDLAAQSTGGRSLDDLSDKERMNLAVRNLQQGMTE